jgi:hypothetical protein
MTIDGLLRLATMAAAASGKAGSMGRTTGRVTAAALCASLAAASVIAAGGCAAAALWLFAIPHVGAAGAPLVAAGGLLVFCVILILVVRGILRYRQSAPRSAAAPGLRLEDALRLFSENKGTVLLAALVAGLVAGNSGRKL